MHATASSVQAAGYTYVCTLIEWSVIIIVCTVAMQDEFVVLL